MIVMSAAAVLETLPCSLSRRAKGTRRSRDRKNSTSCPKVARAKKARNPVTDSVSPASPHPATAAYRTLSLRPRLSRHCGIPGPVSPASSRHCGMLDDHLRSRKEVDGLLHFALHGGAAGSS